MKKTFHRTAPDWVKTGMVLFIMMGIFALHPERSIFAETKDVSTTTDLENIIGRIKKQFAIDIIYQDFPDLGWHKASFKGSTQKDHEDLVRYLNLFAKELGKYPKCFFEKTQLKAVILVKKLFYKDKPAEGFYDWRNNMVIWDFLRSRHSELAQRHNIHHELFHLIEYAALGYLPDWQDITWAQLNDPAFQYGRKNIWDPRDRQSFLEPEVQGFLTPYSMTAIEEDKAEVFACLMMDTQSKIVYRWIKDDPILDAKVRFIKDFMPKFCPEMNEEFWQRIISNQH